MRSVNQASHAPGDAGGQQSARAIGVTGRGEPPTGTAPIATTRRGFPPRHGTRRIVLTGTHAIVAPKPCGQSRGDRRAPHRSDHGRPITTTRSGPRRTDQGHAGQPDENDHAAVHGDQSTDSLETTKATGPVAATRPVRPIASTRGADALVDDQGREPRRHDQARAPLARPRLPLTSRRQAHARHRGGQGRGPVVANRPRAHRDNGPTRSIATTRATRPPQRPRPRRRCDAVIACSRRNHGGRFHGNGERACTRTDVSRA